MIQKTVIIHIFIFDRFVSWLRLVFLRSISFSNHLLLLLIQISKPKPLPFPPSRHLDNLSIPWGGVPMNPDGSCAGLCTLPYWLYCMLASNMLAEDGSHTSPWSLAAQMQ
jgi:hypothetical protein